MQYSSYLFSLRSISLPLSVLLSINPSRSLSVSNSLSHLSVFSILHSLCPSLAFSICLFLTIYTPLSIVLPHILPVFFLVPASIIFSSSIPPSSLPPHSFLISLPPSLCLESIKSMSPFLAHP